MLRRDAVEAGRFDRAELVAWRIKTTTGDTAELRRSDDGDTYELTHLERGRRARALDEVIDETVQIVDLADGDYELRSLLVPSLSLMCAWLHSTTDDLVVPLPGSFYLDLWRAYRADEFMGRLQRLAQTIQRLPL